MTSEGYHIVSSDNTRLYFRYWAAEGATECICIVHGLGEHSGRYNDWAERFVNAGFAVCALDYRGHGLADGVRGHTKLFEKFYEDVDALMHEAAKLFPKARKILYGHSLGGSIVLNYYMVRKPKVSKLIVTSPWFKLATQPGYLMLVLAKFVKSFSPPLLFSNGISPDALSRNPAIGAAYANDKLVHDRISLKLYFSAVAQGNLASRMAYKINKPLLLMHGKADALTAFKPSAAFALNTGVHTTFKEWTDSFHELHNDINNDEVFAYMLQWLTNSKG